MTYTHLTTNELVLIETYYENSTSVQFVAKKLQRSRQTIYNVYNFFKSGGTALEYFEKYKTNKKRCGRRKIVLPPEQQEYIQKRVAQGWNPDVVIGRAEMPIACSARTIYRMYQDDEFDATTLPFKGKRKPTWQTSF